jgi:hypothetical protein
VKTRSIYISVLTSIFIAGCAANESAAPTAAEFVTAELPTLAPQPTSAPEMPSPVPTSQPTQVTLTEAITTTQVNVRAQPSKESPALGMLSIFAQVQITGKDSSGEWYQIIHADSFGWVSAQYVQVDPGIEIPLIAAAEPTSAPVSILPTASFPIAMQDGDSMQSPLAAVTFSRTGARVLQLNGDISAPDGDTEDWLQFTAQHEIIAIKVLCQGSGVNVELWNNVARVDVFPLACGSAKTFNIVTGQIYLARFSAINQTELQHTPYIVYIENVQ